MNRPILQCPKISHPPTLTGNLSLQPWRDLAPMGDLVLSSNNGTPLQLTRVWSCWDDENFYVAFWCEDTDIRGTLTERDAKVWQEEAAEFFVSTDEDLTQYFEFQFSPRNVVRDIRVENPAGRMAGSTFHGEWDSEGLRSAVQVEGVLNDPTHPDVGWSLEVAVPFKDLLGDSQRINAGDAWYINFLRIYRSPQEEFCSLSPTYIEPWEFHVPEYFAKVIFSTTD